jgi:hypothetical protein
LPEKVGKILVKSINQQVDTYNRLKKEKVAKKSAVEAPSERDECQN